MIREAIAKLMNKEDLTYDEAIGVMEEMMDGTATQAQMGGFLTALSMQGETIEEITAFATVMREKGVKITPEREVIDIVGTGGDQVGTFNISTTSAFVVAAGGVPVAKHGNRSVSSKSGAADVLEKLGINVALKAEENEKVLKETGICFFFAPVYHSSMKYAAPVRKELGVRTVFNILGPLSNPAAATMQLLGVYDEKLAEPLAKVLANLGVTRGVAVCGADGLDEITLTGATKVYEIRNGEITSYSITPEQFGLKSCPLEELIGGTPEENAQITLDILTGKETGAKRDVVLMNAGMSLYLGIDGITLEDVENIAKACISLRWDVVAVDPGPFTSKLAFYRELISAEEPNIPPQADEAGKTVLIAAGSATPVTKKQMEILCQDPRHVRVSVEPLPLIEGGDVALDEVFKAVNKAAELLESDNQPRAILFETALHGELLNLDEEDKKHGYAGGMSANRINAGLGTIISQVLEQVGRERIAGLYTTGGDTMVNVCYQLGVECIEVMDYVIPQTDVGRLVGKYDGLPIVGKGGLTGNDNTACDIVERLFKESAR